MSYDLECVVPRTLEVTGKSFIISLIIFLIFILLIAIPFILAIGLIALIIIIMLVVALTIAVVSNKRYWEKIKELREYYLQIFPKLITGVDKRRISFSKNVNVAIGVLRAVGEWYRDSRGHREYRSFVDFAEVKRVNDSVVEIPRELWKFAILTDSEGEGYIELPAIKFLDPEMRGAVLAIVPHMEYEEENYTLNVSHELKDFATANLRVRSNVLEGQITYYKKVKSRAVKLRIKGLRSVNGFKAKVVVDLSECVQEGTVNVQYKLSPDKPLVIVGTQNDIEPTRVAASVLARILSIDIAKLIDMSDIVSSVKMNLAQLSQLARPCVMGFGNGEYSLQLVLDIPRGRDKVAEIKFAPKPVVESTTT